jgi:acyl-CoA dehydrogenase
MHLRFSADEMAFRDELRDFIRDQLPDDIRERMRLGYAPRKEDTVRWQRILNQRGWAAFNWPREYGGPGWTPVQRMIFLEENQLAPAPEVSSFNITMIGPVLIQFGTEAQKKRFLPRAANIDDWWCQGFSEPGAGSDLAALKTAAKRDGDHYVVNGQKIWTSRSEYSDLMLLLARTTPKDQAGKRTDGMSVFILDMRAAKQAGLTIRPIRTMMNHSTTEVFFDNVRIPAENLVGEEGKGFRYILSGMNAERILIAAECIGDAKWFIEKATDYAKERVVFDRPIGRNQGIQFPLAKAYAQMRAAELMVHAAAELFEAGKSCGAEANMAKLLAADASWAAGEACVQTHGGFGFAEEYDIERKFRETRLYQVAPISTNLILSYLAEHVLGLPRSY